MRFCSVDKNHVELDRRIILTDLTDAFFAIPKVAADIGGIVQSLDLPQGSQVHLLILLYREYHRLMGIRKGPDLLRKKHG